MTNMFSPWLRVIRIRFLLASMISVFLGLSINWWMSNSFNLEYAILTLVGVLALHSSVDLLNDYWDYKRNIDNETKRTKFSGGTGVLPEGLLKPDHVYRAGITLLIAGASIGGFFVYERGITIAVILGFAIISIYFYSTRIVDSGLGEIFIAIKGAMIVLGTYFVQASSISEVPILAGIVSGILSSTVLFVNSFPDHDADKSAGRKTLVILLGKAKAASIAWLFPAIAYSVLVIAVIMREFPNISLISLAAIPLAAISCRNLKKEFENNERLLPVMKNIVSFSRITGILLATSFLVDHLLRLAQ